MSDTLKELTDREVDARFDEVFGNPGRKHHPGYSSNADTFELFVLPALDARGLGEKYVRKLTWDLVASGVDPLSLDADDWIFEVIKAPLSLRARAALDVMEKNHA